MPDQCQSKLIPTNGLDAQPCGCGAPCACAWSHRCWPPLGCTFRHSLPITHPLLFSLKYHQNARCSRPTGPERHEHHSRLPRGLAMHLPASRFLRRRPLPDQPFSNPLKHTPYSMPKLVVHHESPTMVEAKKLPFSRLFGASALAACTGEVSLRDRDHAVGVGYGAAMPCR